MLYLKYNDRRAGVFVRRANDTVFLRDDEKTKEAPPWFNPKVYDKQTRMTDDWTGVDFGEVETQAWEWFNEHGSKVAKEEAGPEPTPLDEGREGIHET